MNIACRSVRLTLKMEADSISDLASALFNFATSVDRGEVSTGVSGGVDSGSIYELLHDPTQTHVTYFNQLQDYLDQQASGKNKELEVCANLTA